MSLTTGFLFYMYIYIFSALFAYLASHSKKTTSIIICSLIAILIPSIVGGLRTTKIGVDVMVYASPMAEEARAAVSFSNYMSLYDKGEVGFYFLCYYATKFGGHLNWSLFSYQLLTFACVYIGAYRYRKFLQLYWVYFVYLMTHYLSTHNLMRQSIAASIIFMGLYDLERKHYIRFSLYIIVASLFHRSAYFALPLLLGLHWFITSESISKNPMLRSVLSGLLIIILIVGRPLVSFVLSLNIIPYISMYAGYVVPKGNDSVSGGATLLALGQVIMCFMFRNGGRRFFKQSLGDVKEFEFFYFNSMFCFFWLSITKLFSRGIMYNEYLSVFVLSSLHLFVKEKYLRILVFLSVLGVLMFTFWHHLYVVKGVVYESIL